MAGPATLEGSRQKTTQPQQGPAAAQAPASWPFPTGVLRSENPDYDQTKTMTATAVQMPNYTLEPTGWLRGLEFQIDIVTAANAAAVTFAADAPPNVINKITFKDTGNREVFGPLGGYDWLTIDKYGAYFQCGDPRSDYSFTTTVGAVATGGSASLVLYLPLELVQRDALGTVENKSDNTAWKCEIWIEGTAVVYGVAPTTPGTVRIRITEDSYTEPAAASGGGRPFADTPPKVGTLQYWVQESSAGISGTGSYNLDNGIGYPIRNLIYKLLRQGALTRANGDADWPDPVTLTYGKVQLFQRYKNLWISKIGRMFGDQTPAFTTAAGVTTYNTDAAGGRENGVFPVWFTDDFSIQPGSELRNGYLVTKTGTVLKWKGTLVGGNTDILNVLVNYVIPPNNDYFSLLSGR